MELRLVSASLLLLGSAFAQAPGATPVKPSPAPAAPAAAAPAQDPDKKVQSPEEILKELNGEKERLAREIAYVQERARGLKTMLADKLGQKPREWKSIDAGTNAPAFTPMVPTTPKYARVATPEEMGGRGNDTLLVVNGAAITQRMLDELTTYLAGSAASGDESMRTQRALFELIKIEGIGAAFEQNEAAERVSELVTQLEGGKTIAELAPAVGVVRGSSPEGKLEVTRNSMFGPRLEQVAFATEPGKRARPFRHTEGVVILKVESFAKGATPEQDKVVASALLVPYTPDPQVLTKAMTAVNTAQVDILVRDEMVLAKLPQMFRKPAPMAAPAPGDAARLQQELEQLGRDIATLQQQGGDEAQAKLKVLNQRHAELKEQLRAAMTGAADGDGTTTSPDNAVLRQQLEAIAARMATLQGKTDDASKQQLEGLKQAYEALKVQLQGGGNPQVEKPIDIKPAPTQPPVKKN